MRPILLHCGPRNSFVKAHNWWPNNKKKPAAGATLDKSSSVAVLSVVSPVCIATMLSMESPPNCKVGKPAFFALFTANAAAKASRRVRSVVLTEAVQAWIQEPNLFVQTAAIRAWSLVMETSKVSSTPAVVMRPCLWRGEGLCISKQSCNLRFLLQLCWLFEPGQWVHLAGLLRSWVAIWHHKLPLPVRRIHEQRPGEWLRSCHCQQPSWFTLQCPRYVVDGFVLAADIRRYFLRIWLLPILIFILILLLSWFILEYPCNVSQLIHYISSLANLICVKQVTNSYRIFIS